MTPILQISDPDTSLAFYRDRLGMAVVAQQPASDDTGGCSRYVLEFTDNKDAGAGRLELWHDATTPPGAAYEHSRTDCYWKIGITLGDVDLARERLLAAGVPVSEPRQFRDIGYLCHIADPDGFQIELLQRTFEGYGKQLSPLPGHPLGQSTALAHITLRTIDIDACLAFYRDELGMRLLSRQSVEPYGFTLYFLGHTSETPPHESLDAVENREWLWQRPYALIELQHLHGPEMPAALRLHDNERLGFRGLRATTTGPQTVRLLDPNGAPVYTAPLSDAQV